MDLLNELALDGMLAVLHSFVARLDVPSAGVSQRADGAHASASSSSGWAASIDAWCDAASADDTDGLDGGYSSEVSGLGVWPEMRDTATESVDDVRSDGDGEEGYSEPYRDRDYESASDTEGGTVGMLDGEGGVLGAAPVALIRSVSGLSDTSVPSRQTSLTNNNNTNNISSSTGATATATAADEDVDDSLSVERARARTADVLRQRKQKKERLMSVAAMFNKSPNKLVWVRRALELGLVSPALAAAVPVGALAAPAADAAAPPPPPGVATAAFVFPADPVSVALFIKQTRGLSFVQKGEFLSKGPADRHPFQVRGVRAIIMCFRQRARITLFLT